MKIRIYAETDRGIIDVSREWADEVGGYGFVAREREETSLEQALSMTVASVIGAYSYSGGSK